MERAPMPVGTAGGEARNIAERGGRFVSFLGPHRYFHSAHDTVDRAVDGESVARHADAVNRIVAALRRE